MRWRLARLSVVLAAGATAATGVMGVRPAAAADVHTCIGADALWGPESTCPATVSGPLAPTPEHALGDANDAYQPQADGHNCFGWLPSFPTRVCTFGRPSGKVDIALVGNSHAGAWLPALQQVAARRGWRITTYTVSGCAMSDLPQSFSVAGGTEGCSRWVERTSRRVIADHPDLVVTSDRMSAGAVGYSYGGSSAPYRAGYDRVYRRWSAAGVRVLVLHDTPLLRDPSNKVLLPDCLAAHLDDYTVCGTDRAVAERPDPALDAVTDVADPRIKGVNLNDHLCGPDRCQAAVGGEIVYRDGGHLTATFARSLAPFLAPPVDAAMAAGRTRALTFASANTGNRSTRMGGLTRSDVVGFQQGWGHVRGDLHAAGPQTWDVSRGGSTAAGGLPVATRGLYLQKVGGGPATTWVRFDRDRVAWTVVDVHGRPDQGYVARMKEVVRTVRREQRAGRAVAVTGDFDWRHVAVSRFWSPAQVFARARLHYVGGRGPAGVAVPVSWRVVRTSVIAPRGTGARQPWLTVTVLPR